MQPGGLATLCLSVIPTRVGAVTLRFLTWNNLSNPCYKGFFFFFLFLRHKVTGQTRPQASEPGAARRVTSIVRG